MNFTGLINQINVTDEQFKQYVVRSIDQYLTIRNWLIGHYIFEYEQVGEDRAKYGLKIEATLARQINRKGLSERNLKLFKQFYIQYPQLVQTVTALSDKASLPIVQTVSASLLQKTANKSNQGVSPNLLVEQLSFSHFVELIKIDEPLKRLFYEVESMKGTWSVRELKRQINSLAYERVASAKHPENLSELIQINQNIPKPEELIKTPYVFDFLNLPDSILASESELENALLSDLKSFILELGHGFCFEAQQKRINIGGEYYFIDLVFYHRVLKCHVLIELKIDEFNHTHAGQLNTYLQYYRKNEQLESDNEPIGILLCTNKNEELVEYALGGLDKNLFVSQYKTVLPSTKELKEFLKQEKQKLK